MANTVSQQIVDGVVYQIMDAAAQTKIEELANYPGVVSLADLTEIRIDQRSGSMIRDIFGSLKYVSDLGMSTTTFNSSTVFDYLEHTTESAGAKLYEPVRVRSNNGELIAEIKADMSIGGNPNIAFGYKQDGTPDKTYKQDDIVNGVLVLNQDTFYLIFNKYSIGTYNKLETEVGHVSAVKAETLSADGAIVPLDEHIDFNHKKTISSADFLLATIFDYENYLTDSAITSISVPIIVRDKDGNLITDILCEYTDDIGSATIAFGFKADGSSDYIYKISDVSGGKLTVQNTTYYLILKWYSNIDQLSFLSKYNDTKDVPHYSVGTGKQYSTFTECLRDLVFDNHEKVIDIYGGTYDILEEMGGRDFLETLTPSDNWYDVCDIVPPNTHILGHGNVVLDLTIPQDIPDDIAVHLSPVNIRGSATVENVTITCTHGRYGVHAEGSQKARFNNAVWRLINCKIHDDDSTAVGVGINDGDLFEIRDCIITSGGNTGIMIHDQQVNSGSLPVSPRIVITNCAVDVPFYPLLLSSTHSGATTGAILEVSVINCAFNNKYTRKIGSGHKDVFQVTYINTPHQKQDSSEVIDIIPDIEYNNYALPSQ